MRKATDGGSVLRVENMDKTEITGFLQYLAKPVVRQKLEAEAEAVSAQTKSNVIYVLDGMQTDGTTALYVKMPFNAKLAKGVDIDDRGALANAENYMIWYKAIDKSSFWKELGKISAIDHFNSNFDRFSYGTGMKGNVWEVSNPGNLVIYAGKPLPIDAWNSGKFMEAESDYSKDLSPKVKFGLDVIRNQQQLMTFVDNIIDSVLDFLRQSVPLNGHEHDEHTIKQKYAPEFTRGYAEGVRKIKEVMMHKVAKYGGDKIKKSMNPFASKKPATPTHQAIMNTKMATIGANRLIEKDRTPVYSSIPLGIILRMEYLGWV